VFDEDEIFIEGNETEGLSIRRSRSRRLRALAVVHFRRQGRLGCEACGFDFGKAYGDRGRGYIEIHHRVPIYMYEGEDLKRKLREALANLAALCANCHRMIHRRRSDVWTVDRLKRIFPAFT